MLEPLNAEYHIPYQHAKIPNVHTLVMFWLDNHSNMTVELKEKKSRVNPIIIPATETLRFGLSVSMKGPLLFNAFIYGDKSRQVLLNDETQIEVPLQENIEDLVHIVLTEIHDNPKISQEQNTTAKPKIEEKVLKTSNKTLNKTSNKTKLLSAKLVFKNTVDTSVKVYDISGAMQAFDLQPKESIEKNISVKHGYPLILESINTKKEKLLLNGQDKFKIILTSDPKNTIKIIISLPLTDIPNINSKQPEISPDEQNTILLNVNNTLSKPIMVVETINNLQPIVIPAKTVCKVGFVINGTDFVILTGILMSEDHKSVLLNGHDNLAVRIQMNPNDFNNINVTGEDVDVNYTQINSSPFTKKVAKQQPSETLGDEIREGTETNTETVIDEVQTENIKTLDANNMKKTNNSIETEPGEEILILNNTNVICNQTQANDKPCISSESNESLNKTESKIEPEKQTLDNEINNTNVISNKTKTKGKPSINSESNESLNETESKIKLEKPLDNELNDTKVICNKTEAKDKPCIKSESKETLNKNESKIEPEKQTLDNEYMQSNRSSNCSKKVDQKPCKNKPLFKSKSLLSEVLKDNKVLKDKEDKIDSILEEKQTENDKKKNCSKGDMQKTCKDKPSPDPESLLSEFNNEIKAKNESNQLQNCNEEETKVGKMPCHKNDKNENILNDQDVETVEVNKTKICDKLLSSQNPCTNTNSEDSLLDKTGPYFRQKDLKPAKTNCSKEKLNSESIKCFEIKEKAELTDHNTLDTVVQYMFAHSTPKKNQNVNKELPGEAKQDCYITAQTKPEQFPSHYLFI